MLKLHNYPTNLPTPRFYSSASLPFYTWIKYDLNLEWKSHTSSNETHDHLSIHIFGRRNNGFMNYVKKCCSVEVTRLWSDLPLAMINGRIFVYHCAHLVSGHSFSRNATLFSTKHKDCPSCCPGTLPFPPPNIYIFHHPVQECYLFHYQTYSLSIMLPRNAIFSNT